MKILEKLSSNIDKETKIIVLTKEERLQLNKEMCEQIIKFVDTVDIVPCTEKELLDLNTIKIMFPMGILITVKTEENVES